MDVGILLSFLLFLGFFAGVGLASMRVKQDTTDDYLVAGRGMHPLRLRLYPPSVLGIPDTCSSVSSDSSI